MCVCVCVFTTEGEDIRGGGSFAAEGALIRLPVFYLEGELHATSDDVEEDTELLPVCCAARLTRCLLREENATMNAMCPTVEP